MHTKIDDYLNLVYTKTRFVYFSIDNLLAVCQICQNFPPSNVVYAIPYFINTVFVSYTSV